MWNMKKKSGQDDSSPKEALEFFKSASPALVDEAVDSESSQDEDELEHELEQIDLKKETSETPTHLLQKLYDLLNLQLFDTED